MDVRTSSPAFVVLIALLSVIPAAAGVRAGQPPPATGSSAAVQGGAVAVVPFANISQDAADGWVGVGIAETVVADVGVLDGFSVIGRAQVLAAVRGWDEVPVADAMATELGRALEARGVITGG